MHKKNKTAESAKISSKGDKPPKLAQTKKETKRKPKSSNPNKLDSDGSPKQDNEKIPPRVLHLVINRRETSKTKLQRTLYELLTETTALPYFIQFMENEGDSTLIQFWLAAESFQVTAKERLKVYQGSPANQHRLFRLNAASPKTKASSRLVDDRRQLLGLSAVALSSTDRLGRERRVSERRREAVLQAKKQNIGMAQRQQSESARVDAMNLYETYLSLEAKSPIPVGNELRQQVENWICQSDGFIDPECFQQAQDQVFDLLQERYYKEFLASQYMCRYQIDVLTGGKFGLHDILHHEAMLGYFVQFLEREEDIGYLEFWLTAEHLQEQLLNQTRLGTYDADVATNDCMILYDKYFSLQATHPVGFDDQARFEVENSICREGGPLPMCFSTSQKIAYSKMEAHFWNFLRSDLYYSHLSELLTAVKGSAKSSRRSSVVLGETSGERDKEELPSPEEIQSSFNERLGIDCGENPDTLWQRRRADFSLGHVDEYGVYESCIRVQIEIIAAYERKSFRKRVSRAMKRFVLGPDEDKDKEEMAFRIAKMIVTNIRQQVVEHAATKKTNLLEESSSS
eukprot:m.24577 g.24577  ORF g.24577 m.24577 type:complete len:571 (+) comp28646_c0_seq4:43-1755(+)